MIKRPRGVSIKPCFACVFFFILIWKHSPPPKKKNRNAGEEAHSRGDHSQLLGCTPECILIQHVTVFDWPQMSRPSVHVTGLNTNGHLQHAITAKTCACKCSKQTTAKQKPASRRFALVKCRRDTPRTRHAALDASGWRTRPGNFLRFSSAACSLKRGPVGFGRRRRRRRRCSETERGDAEVWH